MANEATAFETDDFLKNLFGDESSDDADTMFGNLFSDVSPEKPAKEEPPAKEPKAEAPAEPEAKAEEAAPEPAEEPKAETVAEVKEEEVETEDTAETAKEPDTTAEAVAEAKEAVEADASAAEEAEAPEAAEPVVEVKVEKKHRRRRTKKAKAEETKVEEAEDKESDEETVSLPDPAAPINENIVNAFVTPLGPVYEDFRKEVSKRMNNIVIQPDMAPAVVRDMIAKNNELEKFIFFKGQGYFDAYTNLTASKTGLIDRTRKKAEMSTKGNATEKRLAADLAIMNFTFPATGEKINLLQYANALKQAIGFVSNAKDYVKSTSIVLNTMFKAAA